MAMADQDWGRILNSSLLICIFICGFLALTLSIRYCWKTFKVGKHFFLLLLVDLTSSSVFAIAAAGEMSSDLKVGTIDTFLILGPLLLKLIVNHITVLCIIESYIFYVSMLSGLVITADIAVLRLYIFSRRSKHKLVSDFNTTLVGITVVIGILVIHGFLFCWTVA